MLQLARIVRLGLIVGIALLASWLALLWPFYRSHRQDDRPPEPAALLALAQIAERLDDGDQAQLAQAIGMGHVELRIEARSFEAGALPGLALTQDRLVPYNSILGSRAIAAASIPTTDSIGTSLRFLATARPGWRFEVALLTGRVMTVEFRPSLLVNSFGLPVGFVAGLLGTLMALIALLLIHREIRSLKTLIHVVERVDLSGHPLPLSVTMSRAPEIQSLIRSFNRLQTRLGLLMRSRMAMIGGISHDVRTFATRLRLRLDLFPEGPVRDKAIADISDIIALLDDSLLASRAGAGELSEELIEPADILREDIEDRLQRGAAIQLAIAPEAIGHFALGDRVALRRVIANLIDNAEKYAKHVSVSMIRTGALFELHVDDDGPGIPPGRREELLEPFVRLEGSRSRQTGGAGLGLAIVRNLVEALDGSVTIGDAPMGGARFSIRLPVFQP